MRLTEIKQCYIGPVVSPEEFIAEHFFLFLIKGKIHGYDGNHHYTLKAGECCLVRKNHLARYNKQKENNEFEKVVVIFDEEFLKSYFAAHKITDKKFLSSTAFLQIKKNNTIPAFLKSLLPYYNKEGKLKKEVAEQKREELLQLLLHLHPEYASILFDFGKPGKIDLKAFMQKNYKFNVSVRRLAFMTGRSLSAFKRDFSEIFQQTPNRWLIQRRLQEAHFLLNNKKQKPTDIYLDLGFEDLSHFSFAFKKEFGITPTQLRNDSFLLTDLS
jgi:AraC-like DNA-binding protein